MEKSLKFRINSLSTSYERKRGCFVFKLGEKEVS